MAKSRIINLLVLLGFAIGGGLPTQNVRAGIDPCLPLRVLLATAEAGVSAAALLLSGAQSAVQLALADYRATKDMADAARRAYMDAAAAYNALQNQDPPPTQDELDDASEILEAAATLATDTADMQEVALDILEERSQAMLDAHDLWTAAKNARDAAAALLQNCVNGN